MYQYSFEPVTLSEFPEFECENLNSGENYKVCIRLEMRKMFGVIAPSQKSFLGNEKPFLTLVLRAASF